EHCTAYLPCGAVLPRPPPHTINLRTRPMPFSLSQSSIPVFEQGLTALSAILDKAEAFATAKKIDPSVLPNTRLAPDMFPLARQVQVATDMAKNGGAPLPGPQPPKFEDNETTIEQLQARLKKPLHLVKTLDKTN